MSRYIDADKIEYKYISVPMLDGMIVRTKSIGLFAVKEDIDEIPTADVQEVKHGRWFDFNGYTTCSNCSAAPYHYSAVMTFPYCPICGARMDGDANDK